MTSLSDKLTQLKLDFMARELDRVLTDTAARSLSPAASPKTSVIICKNE